TSARMAILGRTVGLPPEGSWCPRRSYRNLQRESTRPDRARAERLCGQWPKAERSERVLGSRHGPGYPVRCGGSQVASSATCAGSSACPPARQKTRRVGYCPVREPCTLSARNIDRLLIR